MSLGGSLQLSNELGIFKNYGNANPFKSVEVRRRAHLLSVSLSSYGSRQDLWSLQLSERIDRPINNVLCRYKVFTCRSFALPGHGNEISVLRTTALALSRLYNALHGSPLVLQLIPAVCVISFALWGLGPAMRHSRKLLLHRNDNNWKKSRTHYVCTFYLQPLLLWTGATLICRVLDPVVLPSEASQAVKQRLLNFVRSLSTVLAFAYCLSSLIQQTQKFFMEKSDPNDSRNVGFQFAGKAMYTAVWVAAVSLFMELLGFSTQKWVTAGGLGTVVLTLAGREIFTNFLSSVMIHATRPFVVNEWIQTKIEGYEVSGTVEHVGWWSPTIIRGDDREAVHIPNHKFTVSVVRNLSQKSHWRIKTHLAISHLDVNKIHNIVADMRKVLAKNPQVEQQRLHRRVFLDNVDPENQALLILVSCFVKTSHFEEYLCVKEAVLLDLLRVVSHHRARLATPIRTVQKVYSDADLENIPFAETIFTHPGATTSRPLLLNEPPSRINGEEKTKARSTSRTNEEQTNKSAVKSDPDPKATGPVSEGSVQSSSGNKQQQKPNSEDSHSVSDGYVQNYSNDKRRNKMANLGDIRSKNSKADAVRPPVNSSSKSNLEGLDSKAAVSEKDQANLSESGTESERLPVTPPPALSRPCLEENIVLGVALDGSKRTLPIEEGMGHIPAVPESAASRNGTQSASSSSRDNKRDGQIPGVPGGTTAVDKRD